MEPSSKTQFRPDIEGLRGVAILFVLLFHAKIPGFTSGFFGVDIFYVISGYLITGLLIRERETTGRISLKTFYARRARRLLPAATVVLVTTLIASYFLAPRLLMSSISFDIAAAALFLSNMNFAHHATDYFANSMPSPVLHFWSLSVEEQYYMIWPALALFFTRKTKSVSIKIFFILLTLGSLSFWFATWLLTKNQSWAFYSLPSRAWELALGGLLASSNIWIKKIPALELSIALWTGILLLVYSALTLKQTDPFPGAYALLPTLATALILLGGIGAPQERGFTFDHLPSRLLSISPLRYLGKISYSLYLWHWPVLILAAYQYKDGLDLTHRYLYVFVSLILAMITYHLVENPLRHGKIIGKDSKKNLITAIATIFAVVLVSITVNIHFNLLTQQSIAKGKLHHSLIKLTPKPIVKVRPITIDFPVPLNLTPSLLGAGQDRPITYVDRCHTQQNLTPSTRPCLYGDLKGLKTIVLFGDSHALAWFPAVNAIAIKNHWRLLSLTMSACTPADIPAWDRETGRIMQNCTLWRKESIAKIIAIKPYAIIVTGTRGFVAIDAKHKELSLGLTRTAVWQNGMNRTIAQLKSASKNVILMVDVPLSIYDPKVCLSQNPKSTLACATPVGKATDLPWQVEENRIATINKVNIIDPSYWVCPTNPCPVVIDNTLVYLDAGHLTATFSTILAPELNTAVLKIIKPSRIIPLKLTPIKTP